VHGALDEAGGCPKLEGADPNAIALTSTGYRPLFRNAGRRPYSCAQRPIRDGDHFLARKYFEFATSADMPCRAISTSERWPRRKMRRFSWIRSGCRPQALARLRPSPSPPPRAETRPCSATGSTRWSRHGDCGCGVEVRDEIRQGVANAPPNVIRPQTTLRSSGAPRPDSLPSSDSASAKPIEMPAPTDAARPTRKAFHEFWVADAAAAKASSCR